MGVENKKKILVVGGTGFIGSAIIRYANQMGWEVDSLGLTTPRGSTQISGVNYLQADLTNVETLKFLSEKAYQYVVNAGGYVNHNNFSNGGGAVLEAHFQGVINLVYSINKNNLIRFIQIGSSDEYGNNPAPQHELVRESPISPYSLGKVSATHMLQMLNRQENLPAVTLRLFLCFGPGQNINRFMPHLIKKCLLNEEIAISPGDQLRDYCFIDDIVEAIFCAMTNDNANGKVLNIASGKPISIKNVVKKVIDIIGSGNPNFGAVPYRPGESMELFADISLARKYLSWYPKTGLSDGLRKTIAYYKNL